MKKILSLVVVISTLLVSFTSYSIRTRFKFFGNESDIVSVDIIEAFYIQSNDTYAQHHILQINDIDSFLNKIDTVKYKTSIYANIRPFAESLIAFKISYSNGEYEFFDDTHRVSYTEESGFHNFVFGSSFKTKAFYTVLFDYISESNVENQKFNYMRAREQISSIEIVERNHIEENGERKTTHTAVKDKEQFLFELENIEYTYINERQKRSNYGDTNMHSTVTGIKITYSNGDFELFNHDTREICYMISELNEHSSEKTAYIGTFNEEQFNSLLAKYIQWFQL